MLIDLVQCGVNLLDFAKRVEEKAIEARMILPKGYGVMETQVLLCSGKYLAALLKQYMRGYSLPDIVMIIFLRLGAQAWRYANNPRNFVFHHIGALPGIAGITITSCLGAIAASIGLIIDDAILSSLSKFTAVMEPSGRKTRHRAGSDPWSFSCHGRVSLATIVIHFPFRLMSGLAGKFFQGIIRYHAVNYGYILFGNLVGCSCQIASMIGYKASLKPHAHTASDAISRLTWLTWFFNKPIIAFMLVAVLVGSACGPPVSLKQVSSELDEGTIVLDYIFPAGTSLEATDAICRDIEKDCRSSSGRGILFAQNRNTHGFYERPV